MDTILNIFILIALLVVFLTLVMGFFALMNRTPQARARSNRLMRYRVYAQASAIIIFVVALILKQTNGA